ncbi:hypothetical protein RRG08_014974 [Elysia crispata]|uniref:Uncharacterized protein n=1 Tax=Elysia crispata TaxID=231223 RepID=A0AAE1DP76_9GAST|nr:hypothetical protein RRG08_014974 [Elysia crispata]
MFIALWDTGEGSWGSRVKLFAAVFIQNEACRIVTTPRSTESPTISHHHSHLKLEGNSCGITLIISRSYFFDDAEDFKLVV